MDYKSSILKVIYTLGGVKTEGEENWKRLLGSIQELRAVIADMEEKNAKEIDQTC